MSVFVDCRGQSQDHERTKFAPVELHCEGEVVCTVDQFLFGFHRIRLVSENARLRLERDI